MNRAAAWAVAVLVAIPGMTNGGAAWAGAPDHLQPQAAYLERCGGCHGVDGRSAPGLVPTLQGSAGYFLCDEQSRAYVGGLPNVAFSQIPDDELAGMLNYVAFELGGKSAPVAARPFTADEVGRFRRRPLTIPDLKAYRRRVVTHLIARCGAPRQLLTEYGFSDAGIGGRAIVPGRRIPR